MNDKLSESDFQEIIRKRSESEISFSRFLKELSQRGIKEYEIEVVSGQATYKGVHSVFKTDPQVSLNITNTFNKNKVIQAIANISLPKEIAEAGILTYRVYIPEKKIIYFGIGGEEIEERLNV
jgi:uncharacterized protein YbcV (DUF1398 family)